MSKIELTFRIHLDAEYHSGSGRRASAVIDSGLLRDENEMPVLRGTLIAGLLRDGLRDLMKLKPLQGLAPAVLLGKNENDGNAWGAEARLFGAAHIRKRWRYSSAHIENLSADQLWGVQPVARISFDPRTRRTRSQALFMQEEGDRRLKFKFTATSYAGDEKDRNDALLLIAAARMVRHLGAARRRGRGACRFELIKAEGLPNIGIETPQSDALTQFSNVWLSAPPAPADPSEDSSDKNDSAFKLTPETVASFETALLQPATTPVRFRVVARLDEPALIADAAQLANAFYSLANIPGGVLLGACATRAAKKLGLKAFDEKGYQSAPLEFIRLFMRGGVFCSGLVPAQQRREGGQRLELGLAAPLDRYVCENYPQHDSEVSDTHRSIDFSLQNNAPDECQQDGCGGKLIRISKSYLALDVHRFAFEPEKREEAHIKMDPKLGRVEEGNLFEYITLEAGQFLVGELLFKTADDWQNFQNLTGLQSGQPETIYLGKAMQRGYGKTALYLQKFDSNDKPTALFPWDIDKRVTYPAKKDQGFRLMLLTDAIVTDRWGRFYHSFDETWIAELLDLDPKQIICSGPNAQQRDLHGFHGQRRMPRWRDKVIDAGSSTGIIIKPEGWEALQKKALSESEPGGNEASGNAATEQAPEAGFFWLRNHLQQLESEGIGLRRNEGFGRIGFNHPFYLDDSNKGALNWKLPIELYRKPDDEEPLRTFKKRWKTEIDEYAKEKAWQEKLNEHALPVAKIIYLYRFEHKDKMDAAFERLRKPNSEYLWGKKLELRETESKIKLDSNVKESIDEIIDKLWQEVKQDHKDPRWHEGLAMLAERISEQAET